MESSRNEASDVIRAMAGDYDAFAALANANVDRMYALARVIVRDADRADDATQEALVRAWRELPRLRDPSRFQAWLRRLLVNACYDEVASLDPGTGTLSAIANPAVVGAEFLASDGTTIWAKKNAGMARIDPADGHTVAGISGPQAQTISFAGDHAWLTVTGQGVLEVDLATNKVTRTIPLQPSPLVPLEAGGTLWVTDFENSALWRIDL